VKSVTPLIIQGVTGTYYHCEGTPVLVVNPPAKPVEGETMMTQKSFIRGHREYLDEKFVKDHPEGQFVIQRRDVMNKQWVNIFVNFRRKTSGGSWLYPHAFGIEYCDSDGFYFVISQNNSFDKTTNYKTLEKFLAACKRFFVKEDAVHEFLFFYNNKDVPGFVEKVKKNIYFCTKNHVSTVNSRKSKIWNTDEHKTKNKTA
jgi:hypothetical protein